MYITNYNKYRINNKYKSSIKWNIYYIYVLFINGYKYTVIHKQTWFLKENFVPDKYKYNSYFNFKFKDADILQ